MNKQRELSSGESLAILKEYLDSNENEILNFKNHRKHNLKKNTFRFTTDLISLDLLISLRDDKRIKNVYFNPSVPPPGSGVDGISMRYKIYIEYYMIKDKKGKVKWFFAKKHKIK